MKIESSSAARSPSPGSIRASAAGPAVPGSPLELFTTFTWLALQGFGGVLAVAQRELVDRKRWLSKAEFIELYSLAQMLPGANVVNLSLMLGDRYFGWRGALAAVGGMLLAPTVIVLVLAASYNQLSAYPAVAGALRGMGAVAAGLMLAMALKLLTTLGGNLMGRWWCMAYALATLVLIVGLRLPLAWVVPSLGILAWLTARACIARADRSSGREALDKPKPDRPAV